MLHVKESVTVSISVIKKHSDYALMRQWKSKMINFFEQPSQFWDIEVLYFSFHWIKGIKNKMRSQYSTKELFPTKPCMKTDNKLVQLYRNLYV